MQIQPGAQRIYTAEDIVKTQDQLNNDITNNHIRVFVAQQDLIDEDSNVVISKGHVVAGQPNNKDKVGELEHKQMSRIDSADNDAEGAFYPTDEGDYHFLFDITQAADLNKEDPKQQEVHKSLVQFVTALSEDLGSCRELYIDLNEYIDWLAQATANHVQ
ncbi:MAG: hypothetical protein AAGJ35_00325 [Myxococcota bacterium]